MVNYRLKPHILEVVQNQLDENDPKCTKETFNRLKATVYTKDEAIEMIGAVLTEEIDDILKSQVPFSEKRYAQKLTKLPNL